MNPKFHLYKSMFPALAMAGDQRMGTVGFRLRRHSADWKPVI